MEYLKSSSIEFVLVALAITIALPVWGAEDASKASQPNISTKEFAYSQLANEADPLSGTSVQVSPEISTRVYLSNSDVNRIICPSTKVQDVVYSQEKGLTAQINGNNVFVKYLVTQDPVTKNLKYASLPTEIYVICGSNLVYSLVAVPKQVPTQTIQLVTGKDNIKKNLEIFSGLPLEKKISTLTKQAYLEQYPDSYVKTPANVDVDIFENLRVFHRHDITIDGEGLVLREYVLALKTNAPLRLEEKMFLKPALTSRPISIALTKTLISPGENVRLFIVEKKNQDN